MKTNKVRKAPRRVRKYSKVLTANRGTHKRNYAPVLDALTGTETGRTMCSKSNITEEPRKKTTVEEANDLQKILTNILAPMGVKVGPVMEIDAMEVLEETQRRFMEGFTLNYGEALQSAWNVVMRRCPVQPGMVSRQQLVDFAHWFQGDNATRMERQLGIELERILSRIEHQIYAEKIRAATPKPELEEA